MNLSIPILICDKTEDVRLLLKEMLTKHGYFHLLEASTADEFSQLFTNEKFVLIHKNFITPAIKKVLSQRGKFLIIAQADSSDTALLATTFGVKHLISFPYTSKTLVTKINDLLS